MRYMKAAEALEISVHTIRNQMTKAKKFVESSFRESSCKRQVSAQKLRTALAVLLLVGAINSAQAQAPVLTLSQPVEGAVARPMLHIKANCVPNAGHCQLAVTIFTPLGVVTVGTYTDSVNTTIDASAYEGQLGLELQVVGTDQNGLKSIQQVQDFFVETSPFLAPVYVANNPIIDFLGNNVLVHNLLITDSPRIVNYTTGAVTAVPFTGGLEYATHLASLTPGGMAFQGYRAGIGRTLLYNWHNGVLDSVAGGNALQVSGNYASWWGTNQDSLYFEDLSAGTTQLIDPVVSALFLHSTGAIAYTHNSQFAKDTLLLYRSGVSVPIRIQALDTLFGSPMTDGKNVVYYQSDRNYNRTTYRYDAKTATNNLLASLGNGSQEPELTNIPLYRVANGYTAYIQLDANNRYQAWIRDTSGSNYQVSSSPVSAYLETVAPNGQLAFENDQLQGIPYGYRYIYDKTVGLTPVSAYQGTSFFQDSSWYVVVGNTLFHVNLQIGADKADSFTIHAKEDSLYTFSVIDFVNHYHSSGSLLNVIIAKIPAHGQLTLSGASVTNKEAIPRTSLANLVYTPATGFVGNDTVVWTGSNGFTPSPANALVVLNTDTVLPTLPPAPQIAGLLAKYCIKASADSFRVTNIPGPSQGVTVVASVDGQPVPVAGDGTITINPWQMTVGTHTVVVIFTNSVGADTTSAEFQIVRAETPVVKLTATPATLTSTTEQVVLTATDVADGGTRPLYTFSTDYSFNSHILQAESDSNTMTISVSTLTSDTTVIYVRMQTDDSCVNTSTIGLDSVVLITDRKTVTPPPDSTGTNGGIVTGPNPFTGDLTIRGLDPAKSYAVSLVNLTGQVALSQAVTGQSQVTVRTGNLGAGLYYLRVYDATGRSVVGKAILKTN
jgi:Secretion system C-terminal sorting domain